MKTKASHRAPAPAWRRRAKTLEDEDHTEIRELSLQNEREEFNE